MFRPLSTLFIGCALLTSAQAAESEKGAAALSLLRAIDEGFVQVYEKVAPTVVVIDATKAAEQEETDEAKAFDFFFKHGEEAPKKPRSDDPRPWNLPQAPSRSEGSGFIIGTDGYILTNNHVIAQAQKLTVRLKDGRSFPAKVVGADDKSDIAVLRIDAKGLPVAEFGDSEAVRVGQLVCAIGTPFNQDYSFSAGWVSGKGRTNLLGPTSATILYEDYIQTDANINPGNSGGPLFDVEGKIIGMNTLINGIGRGLAFAIPATMLQDISQQLILRGKVQRPWLGIRIETLGENPTLREHLTGIDRGVVVDTIEAGAPAYKSDLRPADVITEVDGVKVVTAQELQREVLKKKIGQPIQLTIWRSGVFSKVTVSTGELPGEITKVSNSLPPRTKPASVEALGLKLKDGESTPGAVVLQALAESPAAKAEILAGDLITAVESQPVANAAACVEALARGAQGAGDKGVLLNIDRQGKRTYAVLKPEK